MRSTLHKILDTSVLEDADPVRAIRDGIVQSLPAFADEIEASADVMRDLRGMLDALRGTGQRDFALSVWRTQLPALRRLREEITALERMLAPVSVATSKKHRKAH